MDLNVAIKIIKDSNVSHSIDLWYNNTGDQGAKDLAEQLKDSNVSHSISLKHNGIGAQGAKDLAEQLKDSKISHTINLWGNSIGDQGAKDLALHLKDSNVSHTINLGRNNIGAQGAKDLALHLKDSNVSHYIYLENNRIGAQGARDLAEQLKDSKVSHTIHLAGNSIEEQGARDLALHLKDSNVSHTINLEGNYIGAKDLDLALHLKDSNVSHTIYLGYNEIGDQGAKDLALHLKDSNVSHTIHLGNNDIKAQGAMYLKNMIKGSKFPSNIILDTNTLEEVTQCNDAILAIRDPQKFESKIEGIFATSLPALGFTHLHEDAISIIVQHLGQQETNRINLQYLQDLRIRAVEFYTGEEITAARANYTIKDTLTKHKLDIGRIDKLATLMLLTENIVNLLPKEVKKEVSEHVDIKYLQYGVEGALGLGSAYLGYESEMDEWSLPLKRVGGFYFKEAIANSLVINMESIKRMVDEYTEYTLYEHIGEKEQSLILETVFGIGIGMFSPAPMVTMGVISLGAVRNYLDIEEQNIGKIGGGVVGLAGAYYAGIGTYYQYVASMISAAYVGEMLVGMTDIIVHGTGFRTNSVLEEYTEDRNIKDIDHIGMYHKIEESHVDL